MTFWQQAHLFLLAIAICVAIHSLTVRTHRSRIAAAVMGAAVVIANVIFMITAY